MKIGIVLISEKFSGGEKFVYELINKLSVNKELGIILFINKNIVKYYATLNNIRIIKLNELNTKNGLLYNLSLIKIKKQIRKYFNILDLFLLNLEGSFRISNNLESKKMLPVLHGGEVNNLLNNFSFRYKIFTKPKITKILDKALKIISVSHHQIQNLPEKYKKKTIVIPNGVDSNILKPLKNIKQKKNVILFIGRFIELKGIKEILAIAKQLPQYEFWFAGQGPLENLINLPNTENLGFKTSKELVKLYNQATICIFPSHREGMPLVGLEAMSCERAVIATPLGFSEYIENGKDGIIIPAKDEKSLKTAIVDLMKNPAKRKKIEKNARKKALKYSWDKIARQYLKVFKNFIRKHKK